MNNIPIYSCVKIKCKDSMYNGEWGIVKHFDGEYYYVALWNGDTQLIFSKNELKFCR